MTASTEKFLALSGGIGGAKLALGLSHALQAAQLTVAVNTGDDFEYAGLNISPDIDTLIYTLADLNNTELGWGRRDESWNYTETCSQLGMDTWFQLGDRDLAIHLYRTRRLREGASLELVTRELAARFRIGSEIIPMSNMPVRTMLESDRGLLPFQEYFVKNRCMPVVKSVHYDGVEAAVPAPALLARLQDEHLRAIIICPSNPFLSVQPLLSIPGMKSEIKASGKPVIVVSPLINGQSVKGPTAKLMQELGLPSSVITIARMYSDIATAIVIDRLDEQSGTAISDLGLEVHCTNILMRNLEDKIDLAAELVEFAVRLQA